MNAYSVFGSQFLALALPVSLYSALLFLIGFYQGRPRLVLSAERATILIFWLLTLASLSLIGAFVMDRFDILYVYNYSNATLPLFYKITGLWAGLDGSLLFWTWLLGLYAFIILRKHRHKNPDWMPVINVVMMAIIIFFLSLLIFANNPFTPNPREVLDGKGLNPLLQNIAMVIHPPCLYLGFTGFAVPFAFSIAALVSRRVDMNWIEDSRRWTLVAWGFLTLGLILGGAWAYVELGWGGFWAWDPVENAGLMPWLTASAYLHSVITQKKRGMLALWNVCLIMLTFILTIFGTYLTRSGIVQSVHAFSESNLGPYFLIFIGIVVLVCLYLVISRVALLRNENILDSFLSKEAAFLLNNIILLVGCLAVFWGTLFPTISEWVTGERITVGIPFFNRIMAPIGLVLLLLMAIGPMISWRRASFHNFRHNLLFPMTAGFLAMLVTLIWVGQWYVLGSVFFIVATLGTLALEFARGMKAMAVQRHARSWPSQLVALFLRANRRYGGYVVHLGVLLIFMGIAGTVFKTELDFRLSPGQERDFAGYRLYYNRPVLTEDTHKTSMIAEVSVFKGKEKLTDLAPAKFFYKNTEQPTTEVDLYQTALWDLYLIIGSMDPQSGQADFRASLNPLISFIWLGGIVILVGVGIILLPQGLQGSKVPVLVLLVGLSSILPGSVRAQITGEGDPHSHRLEAGAPLDFAELSPEQGVLFRAVSEQLICQCRGCVRMSLASCTCDYAHKEKQLIIGRISAGATEAQIRQEFIDRYGLSVLAMPPEEGFFQIGYWFPLGLLLIACLFGILTMTRWVRGRRMQGLGTTKVQLNSLQPTDRVYYDKLKQELTELP